MFPEVAHLGHYIWVTPRDATEDVVICFDQYKSFRPQTMTTKRYRIYNLLNQSLELNLHIEENLAIMSTKLVIVAAR